MRRKKNEGYEWDRLDFLALMMEIEAHPKKPHVQRVEKILELLSGVHDGMSRGQKLVTLTALRNALRRYKWVFHIEPTAQGLRVMTLPAYDLLPEPTDERVIRLRTGEVFSKGDTDELWEQRTVRGLLDGIDFGSRPRIRRCEECSDWFFAETPKQRFHSKACRQRAHYAKPEKREDKKKYMHDRYQQAKKDREDQERKEREKAEALRQRLQARDREYATLRKKRSQ